MSWHGSRSSASPAAAVLRRRALLAVLLAGSLAGAAIAQQPCNPIIDGTYCATNMPRVRDADMPSSRDRMRPLDDTSRLVPNAAVGGAPGTLFGISSQHDRTCFGLLRRSNC